MKRLDEETRYFGKRLRNFRTQCGLNAEGVARAIRVSPSTYRDWENGRAITGLPYLRLAAILSVSLKELFGVEDQFASQARQKIEVIEHHLAEIKRML